MARPFDPNGPIPVTGRLAGDQISLLPVGPVTVGARAMHPVLDGLVSPDGRRMDGIARFGNITNEGTWFAVKQRRYLIAASDYGIQGTASIVTVRFNTIFTVDRDVELISGVIQRLEAVKAAAVGVVVATSRAAQAEANRLIEGTRRWRITTHVPQTLLGVFRLLQATDQE